MTFATTTQGSSVWRWYVLLLLAAWAVTSLFWPFGRDQRIFAWVGDVILAGGMPYRDAWEGQDPAHRADHGHPREAKKNCCLIPTCLR